MVVTDAVKDYPGQRALDHMTFGLSRGEVHALVGENGAGKSTLIKAVAGVIGLDSGVIEIDGKQASLTRPQDAIDRGISVVHQHGNLVGDMSVLENVLLADGLDRHVGVFVDWRRSQRRAEILLERVGLDVNPNMLVRDLGPHQAAMVAIAKALASDAKVIILDEPTTALLPAEVRTLFTQMRRLADEGIAFVFVTHRLGEVFDVCDRITVMRDGGLVGTWVTSELDHSTLVDQLVGPERSLAQDVKPVVSTPGDVLLCIRDLHGEELVGVDLDLRAGEVVGVASLPGEGSAALFESLFGMRRSTGSVTVEGHTARLRSPRQAIRSGLAMVPRDRSRQGLIPDLSVRENATLASTRDYVSDSVVRFMRRDRERTAVGEVMGRLNLKTAGLEAPVCSLSGGNQQKVVIGRWLLRKARVYLLDSPTAAVDVHAKAEIYALIRELVADGAAVLFTSTELEEFVRVCDRVVVLYRGEVVGELIGRDLTVNSIMRLSFGRKSA
jgi:ABC-type sugar transport system ATPase subunit